MQLVCDGNGDAFKDVVPEGMPCYGGVCDGTGQCIPCIIGESTGCSPDESCYESNGGPTCSTCHNEMIDGDETDVDCGGSASGAACPKCELGKQCISNNDCELELCQQGTCCNKNCDGMCRSCNQLGYSGTCTLLPAGTIDPSNPSCVCDLTGDCSSKMANGAPCYIDNDCASGRCYCFNGSCGDISNPNGECRQDVGTSCTDNEVCFTNKCDIFMNKCVP